MNVTESTNLKILRFDWDNTEIPNAQTQGIEQVGFIPQVGIIEGRKWIGVRWTVNILNKTTNNEICGILAEHRAIVEEKNGMTIERWVYNSFMNVGMYYEDNAPGLNKYISIPEPNIEGIAKKLVGLLKKLDDE